MLKKLLKQAMRFLYTKLACLNIGSFKSRPYVNFYSRFTKQTHLGKNCHFNGLTIRGKGLVSIGDNFHSGKSCLFINTNHQYENANALPYDTTARIDKKIIIEDNVWLGDKVLVLGGVTIGEGAIIQAGSVVSKSIEKFAIAGGNPAVQFKSRDVAHYQQLKKENKFC